MEEAMVYGKVGTQWLKFHMPDGTTWGVPLLVVARNRAKHYAFEFDGDEERSLMEDSIPLFEAEPFEAKDWAANNMNWEDFTGAQKLHDGRTRLPQEMWSDAELEIYPK